MEFEVLHHPEGPASPLEAMRRYLANPRRQMQAWGDRLPGSLALMVFLLVVVELTLAYRVLAGLGSGPSVYPQAMIFAVGLLLGEALVIAAASSVAGLMEKAGKPWTAWAYMNLDLAPLLLWLPVVVLTEALDWSGVIRLVVLILILTRIASRWRDVIQSAFNLSRLQTFIVFYGAVTGAGALVLMLLYAAIFGQVLSVLTA